MSEERKEPDRGPTPDEAVGAESAPATLRPSEPPPSEPRVVVLLNPAAGKGAVRTRLVPLRERIARLWTDAEIFLTTGPGHAARVLADLPLAPGSTVIGIGGDGTVHELGVALYEREGVALGVVPLGSGNDVAAQLGMPRDPLQALETIRRGVALPWDIGIVGPHPFLNSVGFALSAETCYWSHRTGPLVGLARYGLATARAWWHHRPLRLTIDGTAVAGERSVTMIEIGVGDRSGGGFRITGRAVPDDGLLDVCVVGPLGRWQIPFLAPRARRGRHFDHPSVNYEQLAGFRLRLEKDTPIHVDGEMRELPRGEHSVRVRPRALRLIVAPDHPRIQEREPRPAAGTAEPPTTTHGEAG